MDEEQFQIKRSIGEKSEEFKNVFLEQMSPKQSLIKSVVIGRILEERENDMIPLEDPSHGHEEVTHNDRVKHEGELWDKRVPAGPSTRARAKRIQQVKQRLLLHVHGEEVELLGELHLSGQYSLSLKPSLDDLGFDLILLLLSLTVRSSRFASSGLGIQLVLVVRRFTYLELNTQSDQPSLDKVALTICWTATGRTIIVGMTASRLTSCHLP
ncbi:hypothetical protein CRG98_044840 [Punica granatum]|uniref:Uncharacterized protein n=1 Tax=Punica granatum TaxID=22663 RepID=A0A2I0HT52_PUNGR|nr:hypothetical protein CRG98_044840 [Punica granatum]